jgi:hypothetical protein
MNLLDILVYAIIALIWTALMIFVGRCLDPTFRAKLLRMVLKKDYGILGVASKDRKNIKKIVVNFEKTIIKLGTDVWIIKGGRIFREEKPEQGFSFINSKGQIAVNTMRVEEGIPILYVDADNLKPLDLWPEKDATTKNVVPEEMGSWLMSWIGNQIAKGMNVIAEYRILLIAILIVSLIIIIFLWFLGGRIDKAIEICTAAVTPITPIK